MNTFLFANLLGIVEWLNILHWDFSVWNLGGLPSLSMLCIYHDLWKDTKMDTNWSFIELEKPII